MIKIKFNGLAEYHTCEFSRMSDHVITLGKCKVENSSGFTTHRLNGAQLGNFSDYTTVYRVLENGVQYSNDGSVYVEPEPQPEPTPDPDPTPSDIDRIAAQVLYTALMTDTLLEEGSGDV